MTKTYLFPTCHNFPKSGFHFPDITQLLESEPQLYQVIVKDTLSSVRLHSPDVIVCIESFGYIFGAPIAYVVGCPLVVARRSGKLPRTTVGQAYEMCYSSDRCIEMNEHAIEQNCKVLIIDDFLASGGTFLACATLAARMGASTVIGAFAVELPQLGGGPRIRSLGYDFTAAMSLQFEDRDSAWCVEKWPSCGRVRNLL